MQYIVRFVIPEKPPAQLQDIRNFGMNIQIMPTIDSLITLKSATVEREIKSALENFITTSWQGRGQKIEQRKCGI